MVSLTTPASSVLTAPRHAASSCMIRPQSASSFSARSTDSTCPRRRRSRLTSLVFLRMVCAMGCYIPYRGMISKLSACGASEKCPAVVRLPPMAHDLVCWKCGAPLAELSLPLRRLEELPKCHAELHVCRMCIDYDTRIPKHCREPTAEEVNDKTHANFCDHFKPRAAAYTPPNTAEVDKVRTELEKLFGK